MQLASAKKRWQKVGDKKDNMRRAAAARVVWLDCRLLAARALLVYSECFGLAIAPMMPLRFVLCVLIVGNKQRFEDRCERVSNY